MGFFKKIFCLCALLSFGVCLCGQEIILEKTEKLRESRILARGIRGFRGLLPCYGLPENIDRELMATNCLCDMEYSAAVSHEKGVWTSMNVDLKMPNWVAWDLNFLAVGAERDPFMARVAADKKLFPEALWQAILNECYRFGFDGARSPATVVCGPLVSKNEISKGAAAVPYEYFVVICKKVKGGIGWQSIGFLVPNNSSSRVEGLWKYSVSVNLVEYKSGYDFFKRLPSHLEELVEEMTTYELFCPFIEEEVYLDDPFEGLDPQEMLGDYLDDVRDAPM